MKSPDSVSLDGGQPTVNMDAKLDSLIDLVSDTDGPCCVVDDEGNLCGEINQSIVLKAMNSRS